MRRSLTIGTRPRLLAALAGIVVAATACVGTPSASGSGAGDGDAATTGRFCEGTNLVFFPGGTSGGGFETVVYNGAKAAEEAFGPTVTEPSAPR